MIRSNEYVVLGNMSTPTRIKNNGLGYDGPIGFVSQSSQGFEIVCAQYLRERAKGIQYIDAHRPMDPMEMMELFHQRMERSVN